MKIIAKVDFSAELKCGDSYELPESDARLLIAAGLADAADAPARPESAPSRRSTYRRRDLTAEE